MSHRLQILLDSRDYSRIRRAAAAEKKSVSEWVRGLIRFSITNIIKRHPETEKDPIKVLADLRLPAPPIEQMLREIEEGRK